MKPPVEVSTKFAQGRSVRCIDVVTKDASSMRGFALGLLSGVAIIAAAIFLFVNKGHLV